ncbi:peptidylprolyl isomerase [Sphingopyxis sp.]|uniref:peptidylprolyl isomerase n=1 Tax=Sphingopyxis sp. TaxID=1908224 RepID=UPI002607AA65|nr:peptidylprolyl isomerase [Sphingopyxis sp.]MCW0199995.1 peptidylprolyl isomerase [Sphingopyxis sp.]
MRHLLLAAALLALPVHADEPVPIPSPGEIAAAAPARDWIAIAPSDLLVMDLAPDAKGKPRRVVIQLMPPPFSQGWIGNIRKLAAAHWWDGTAVTRVQDNYVAQWGDPTEKKPLPEGLATLPESEYVTPVKWEQQPDEVVHAYRQRPALALLSSEALDGSDPVVPLKVTGKEEWSRNEGYPYRTAFAAGWPVAGQGALNIPNPSKSLGEPRIWPIHCYGAVGVGRNMSPDTGSGAELYAVIGHAPRHLDRNIALVGRVISGIEHLSSLPRGTGDLGFYEDAAERVPIVSIRLAADLPAAEQPKFEYLSTDSDSFARYADARANRRDPFFITPAGGADICNVPVPIRPVAAK